MKRSTIPMKEPTAVNRLERLGTLLRDEPMKLHTTFKTGGPADYLFYPRDGESLAEALMLCRELDMPLTAVGGGSNLLVGDRGIRGLVVVLAEDRPLRRGVTVTEDGLVYADATARKSSFISFCAENGFESMEFLAGIPGCMGGGVIMNAGTTMGNVADI
ncbi:MAG TPA: FAD-binding protein, partial [Spirochaetes bacterium]|nr:FAD-binding protein [Spirochaetota bacterium]